MTNCHQLKLSAADGKLRYFDVADLEQMEEILKIKEESARCFKIAVRLLVALIVICITELISVILVIISNDFSTHF